MAEPSLSCPFSGASPSLTHSGTPGWPTSGSQRNSGLAHPWLTAELRAVPPLAHSGTPGWPTPGSQRNSGLVHPDPQRNSGVLSWIPEPTCFHIGSTADHAAPSERNVLSELPSLAQLPSASCQGVFPTPQMLQDLGQDLVRGIYWINLC